MVIRFVSALGVRRAGERLLPDRKAVEREGRVMFAGRVVAGVLLAAVLALYAIDSPWIGEFSVPLPGWLRWTGFILGLASLVLWAWAQAALGKEWSPQLQLRRKHRLVDSGPYARVRHPIYAAMFGWGLGVALLTANWVFVVFVVVMVLFLLARVPEEEQMMIGKFGEEYKQYAKKTRYRLVPGVW